MANISPFGIEERGASDTTAVQAPVQDNSAAMVSNAIAGGFSSLGGVASAFGQGAAKIKAADEKASEDLADARNTELGNRYIQGLELASGSIDQEGGSRDKAKVFISKMESQFAVEGLSNEEMLDLKIKHGKTFAGKKLDLGTVQDQAELKREDKGIEGGWIKPHMTGEQVNQALVEMDTFDTNTQANAQAMKELQLRKATGEAVESEIKQLAFKSIGTTVAGFRPQVKTSIEDVLTRMGKGEYEASDAIKLLQANLGDLNANIANIGRGGDLAQIKFMSDPLRELYTRTISDLKAAPESALSKLTNANALIKAKAENNLLANPDLANAAATSTLFGHSPVVAALVSNEVATHILKNSKTEGPPANLTGDKEEQKGTTNYLEGLTEGIGVQDQVSFDGSPMVDPNELFTNVEQTLNGANRYLRPEDPVSESKALVEWMANPQVGEYLKTNMGKLDSAARTKLGNTLLTAGEQQVFPEVRDELKFVMRGSFIDPKLGASSLVPADINLTVVGNQVVFKAATAGGRIPSMQLNQKASKALTTYLRAISNVSGTDLATVLEENMASIWPAKAVAEQEEAPKKEEGTQGTAPSSVSIEVGMTVPDTPEGKVNGTFTKGGRTIVVSNGAIIEVRNDG